MSDTIWPIDDRESADAAIARMGHAMALTVMHHEGREKVEAELLTATAFMLGIAMTLQHPEWAAALDAMTDNSLGNGPAVDLIVRHFPIASALEPAQ